MLMLPFFVALRGHEILCVSNALKSNWVCSIGQITKNLYLLLYILNVVFYNTVCRTDYLQGTDRTSTWIKVLPFHFFLSDKRKQKKNTTNENRKKDTVIG